LAVGFGVAGFGVAGFGVAGFGVGVSGLGVGGAGVFVTTVGVCTGLSTVGTGVDSTLTGVGFISTFTGVELILPLLFETLELFELFDSRLLALFVFSTVGVTSGVGSTDFVATGVGVDFVSPK
jgi:hypothetical protein